MSVRLRPSCTGYSTECLIAELKPSKKTQVRRAIYNPAGPAFLMLANEYDDIRVALGFTNASGANVPVESHWLRHLADSEWVVCFIQSAEEARVVVMGHLRKDLPPL